MTHIELIKPTEKIGPELGGTGYLSPSQPATLSELTVALREEQIVWKVARASVNWERPAMIRLLNLDNLKIRCKPIGSTREWYFVQVLDAL